jgi:thiamine-phosphate diphosphorylase
LYLILDRAVDDYSRLFQIAQDAIAAGVDIIQLRDKTGQARDVLRFARQLSDLARGKILFIVNDRADIAYLAEADGVHLGQEDLPVADARRLLGKHALIGASCQNTRHVERAVAQGADYIGFGSVFKTQTKPDREPMDLRRLETVVRDVPLIPLFGIGGITLDHLERLKARGCRRVAVCRAVCQASDVGQAVNQFKKALEA